MWLNVVLTPPRQRYVMGEPGKRQGRDGVGIVERSFGYRSRGVSFRGKFDSSRNLGYEEDRHVSKRSSDPPPQQRDATGEPGKVQGRNSVWIVVGSWWVAGLRGQYSEKIRFIKKPGVYDEGVATWLNVVLTP